MKYYTKEWYKLLQRIDYIEYIQMIPDKDYTDMDINALYKEKKDKYVNEFADNYNEIELYKKEFENEYNFWINSSQLRFKVPSWVFEELNIRLIALGMYPETIYSKLKNKSIEYKNEFDQIELAASKELSEQVIPTEYREILELHDANIIKIENHDEGIVLSLSGVFNEYHSSDYIKILFTGNSKIITNELGDIETYIDDDGLVTSDCIYLYHEIWNDKSGYRLDVLCDKGYFDLAYLSIQFEKLEII